MRRYPTNSPRAAARILALTLLADGHLRRAEIDALARLDAPAQLGLSAAALRAVLGDLCDDLLADARQEGGARCRVAPAALDAMLAEIDDRELQDRVLALCLAVATADGEVAEAEGMLLATAAERWGLSRVEA